MSLTPEQLQARIEEEAEKGVPDDVQRDMARLVQAAVKGELAISVQMVPESGRVYYGVTHVTAKGMMVLAIIPERITPGAFVCNYDEWMDRCGASTELDPEFKGVRQ